MTTMGISQNSGKQGAETTRIMAIDPITSHSLLGLWQQVQSIFVSLKVKLIHTLLGQQNRHSYHKVPISVE